MDTAFKPGRFRTLLAVGALLAAAAAQAASGYVVTPQQEKSVRVGMTRDELAVEMAEAAYQRDGQLTGVSTGLVDLDRLLGGLHRSDLIILAGRPSMGKTALATNIAFNAARSCRHEPDGMGGQKVVDGAVVGFFSLEIMTCQHYKWLTDTNFKKCPVLVGLMEKITIPGGLEAEICPHKWKTFLDAIQQAKTAAKLLPETIHPVTEKV
jgi:hypothetical protein